LRVGHGALFPSSPLGNEILSRLRERPLRRRDDEAAMPFVAFAEGVAFGDGETHGAFDVVDFVVERAEGELDPIIAGRQREALDDAIERARALQALYDRARGR